MTNPETEAPKGSFFASELKELGALIAGMFCFGAAFGMIKAHLKHGGGVPSLWMSLFLAASTVGFLLSTRYIYRSFKTRWQQKGGLSRREHLNRKILIACGVLGLVIGVTLAATGISRSDIDETYRFSETFNSVLSTTFNNGEISPTIAIVFTSFWLIIMPLITWYWWKNAIDEQEISAYKDGALWSGTFYIFAAPAWWMLAKGGFTSEPNGAALFIAFSFIWCGVWLWKKYR